MAKQQETINDEWEGGVSTAAQSVTFNKEKDWFKGTLTGSKEATGKYGPTRVWTAIGIAGSFHKENSEDVVTVTKGASYYVWNKNFFEEDLQSMNPGEIFGIMYTGEKISKSTGKPYKTYEVKKFGIDPTFVPTEDTNHNTNVEEEPIADIMDPEFGKPPFDN